MNKFLLTIATILTLLTNGFASVSVKLEMDRTEATISESLTLTLKLEGTRSSVRPSIYGLQDFHVESGGKSSQFNMINGTVNSFVEQVYYLTPKKVGSFIIGPALVDFNGQRLQSNKIKVQIKKNKIIKDPGSGEPIFVTAEVSETIAYPGQELFYKIKFYLSISVGDLEIILPKGKFSLTQLGDKPAEFSVKVKGKNYKAFEFIYSLTFEETGVYNLSPCIIKMNIIERRRDTRFGSFFDNFMTTRKRPHEVRSKPLKVEIKTLPEKDRPADFSGLVGSFSFESKLSPQKIPARESATLSVILNGRGNVDLIPELKLPLMEDIKVYADQPVIDVKSTKQGKSGTKTMKWALVPQKEGQYTIPQLTLSYFDPKLKKYQIAATKNHSLFVTPGKKENPIITTNNNTETIQTNKKEVKMVNRDILPIHDMPEALKIDLFHKLQNWQIVLLIIFPPMIFMIIKLLGKIKGIQNIRIIAAKKAFSNFNQNVVQSNDLPTLLKYFNIFLNDRSKLAPGHLSPEEIEQSIIDRSGNAQLALEVKNMISKLESLVYAGQNQIDISQLKNDLINLAKKIDKGVKC